MAVTARTWVTDTIATAAQLNTVRDDILDLDGRVDAVIRYFQLAVFDWGENVSTGDAKWYIHIPEYLTGYDLVEVHAEVIVAGTTGTTDIQIHNLTDASDMLSTVLTIDSGETGSDTAATPAVINTTEDDVVTNDVIRIDIDAVSTTPPKGLILTLGFRKP